MAQRSARSLRAGLALPFALLACCGPLPQYSYRGTGELRSTGSTSTELASSSVAIAVCPGDSQADPPSETFTIMTVGNTCTVVGWGDLERLRPAPGNVCSLAFADGSRTLRVTDVVASHGSRRRVVEDTSHIDTSYIDVALGGDDAASGQHALYRFRGRLMGKSVTMDCEQARKRMEQG